MPHLDYYQTPLRTWRPKLYTRVGILIQGLCCRFPSKDVKLISTFWLYNSFFMQKSLLPQSWSRGWQSFSHYIIIIINNSSNSFWLSTYYISVTMLRAFNPAGRYFSFTISQKRGLMLRKVKEFVPGHTVQKYSAGIRVRHSDSRACVLNHCAS